MEVAKLNLLLKASEGGNAQAQGQFTYDKNERLLPDLERNIVCGNSLVEWDVLKDDMKEREKSAAVRKLNPMSFKQAFASIEGFDAVIGNPPYVFGRDWKALGIDDEQKKYLGSKYSLSPYQMDMFSLFMERSFQLCRDGGYVGEIVPNVWLNNTYSSVTREFFLKHTTDLELTTPPKKVFEKIVVDTVVYVYKKGSAPQQSLTVRVIDDVGAKTVGSLPIAPYLDGKKPISLRSGAGSEALLEKIKCDYPTLGDFAEITRGVHPYRTGGYGQSAYGKGPQIQKDVDNRPYHFDKPKKGLREFIYGKDLKRFKKPEAHDYISYGPHLAEPRDPKFFEGPRLYSRKILGERLVLTYVDDNSVADQQVYITKPVSDKLSPLYLAGILGSKLMVYFIKSYYDEVDEAFPQIKVSQLRSLPIRVTTEASVAKALASIVKSRMKATNERECYHWDCEIDRLVYELYGLSEEEIRIVEGG